jgi:uncharacterized protein YybS (DUF2232 family)
MSEQAPVSAPARAADKAEPRPSGILGAGLLSAFLFSVSLFLPLLFPAGLVSPFPILLQRLRSGAGAAALATLVAVGTLGIVFSVVPAGTFLILLVIPTLLIPEAMARGRGLLRGCGWAFVVVSMLILLALFFRGGAMATRFLQPLEEFRSPQFLEGLKASGLPPERVADWDEQMTQLHDAMAVVFPGAYVIAGALIVLANAVVLRFYLARRDPGWLEGGEFERIRWSPLLAMGFVLAGGAVALPDLRLAAYNVLLVLAFFFLLQGLAVTAFYAHRLAGPPFLRIAVVVLVLVNPWAPQILALLGLFDTWIDFRKWAEPPPPPKPL